MPEAKLWRDALGFVASEVKATTEEMLANEDCDAVGSERRVGDIVPDSVVKLIGFEDVVVEAVESISIRESEMDCIAAYLT